MGIICNNKRRRLYTSHEECVLGILFNVYPWLEVYTDIFFIVQDETA